MTEQIKNNLDNPNQLEKLYRENKTAFKKEFNNLYADIKQNTTAQIWNERLNFESEEISWGTKNELVFVIIASLIAGFIAKLPHFFGFTEEFFYQRNFAFIVFPLLAAYFAWKKNVSTKKMLLLQLQFWFQYCT